MNPIQTIHDLKKYLQAKSLSPEQFASTLGISNMTIRRLLKKKDSDKIPPKYLPHFAKLFAVPAGGFSAVLGELEQSGKIVDDTASLKKQFSEKLGDDRIDQLFSERLKVLGRLAFNKANAKHGALCVGAILYFINPLDMIPDIMGPMGLIDDFGVVTLVYHRVFKKLSSRGK